MKAGIVGLGDMGIGTAKEKDHFGHIHIKDGVANIARTTVCFCPLGEGDMAP